MTTDERNNLLRRYKRDPLFRQWLPTLGELARAGHGGEVEIWHEAERALCRLKREADWREAEVQLIYSDLSGRYPESPLFCLAVMAVLLTCLADAAPSLDRVDENPYRPICVAILVMLDGDRRFHALLGGFFGRSRDNRGERVVLPVTDYVALGGEVEEEEENGLSPDEVVELRQVVDEAIATHDPDTCSSLLPVVSSLNAKTGHSCQLEVDRLTCEIYRLRAERNQPRRVENRGTYIENNQGPVNGDVKEQKILLPNDYEPHGANRCLGK